MKRILSFILATAIAFSFAACSDGVESDGAVTTAAATSAAETESNEITAASVLSAFEKKDLEGMKLRVLTSNYYNASLYYPQASEGLDGEPINDAIYERDNMLSEYFNFEFEYTIMDNMGSDYNGLYNYVNQTVRANEDAFDLVFGNLIDCMSVLAAANTLYDLNKVDYVELSNDWWSRNAHRDLSLTGKIFMMTGDITSRYVFSPNVLLFNKTLFDDYTIEYPYQMVYDGTWTLDNFAEIVKDKYYDINGNSKADTEDRYGYTSNDERTINMVYAAGKRITTTNSEGIPEFTFNNEGMIDVIGKIADIMGSQDVHQAMTETEFSNDQLLMMQFPVCNISYMKDMESDYGFLPLPKLDEAQAQYYSYTNPWISTFVGIPITAPSTSDIGLLLEATAATARYSSSIAAYDVTLLTKRTRDEDSAKTLRIAVESSTYEPAILYKWGAQISAAITTALLRGSDASSKFASYEKSAIKLRDKTLDKINPDVQQKR